MPLGFGPEATRLGRMRSGEHQWLQLTVFSIFSGVSLIGAMLNEFMKRHSRRISPRSGRASEQNGQSLKRRRALGRTSSSPCQSRF